jgi:hypothetical protein
MAFKIPREEQENLIKLFKLNDAQYQEIIAIIKNIDLNLNINDLILMITSKIDSIPIEEARKIVPSIIHLNYTFYKSDMPLEKFVDKIFLSFEEFKITEDKEKIYKARLKHILDIDKIKLISKSSDLLTQHENVLCGDTRIFTDIRPVFGDSPENPPIGFLLVHKLKIQYMNNDEMKEIFISMDTKDIKLLKEVLDRADAKAKSLESVINRTAIPYIEVK